jgi:hypothetical protein
VDVVGGGEDVVDVETGIDDVVEGALETENGDETGGGGEGGGRSSKISTTFE